MPLLQRLLPTPQLLLLRTPNGCSRQQLLRRQPRVPLAVLLLHKPRLLPTQRLIRKQRLLTRLLPPHQQHRLLPQHRLIQPTQHILRNMRLLLQPLLHSSCRQQLLFNSSSIRL